MKYSHSVGTPSLPSKVISPSLCCPTTINSTHHSSRTQEEQVPFFSKRKSFEILLPRKAWSPKPAAAAPGLAVNQLPAAGRQLHAHTAPNLSSATHRVCSTCSLLFYVIFPAFLCCSHSTIPLAKLLENSTLMVAQSITKTIQKHIRSNDSLCPKMSWLLED